MQDETASESQRHDSNAATAASRNHDPVEPVRRRRDCSRRPMSHSSRMCQSRGPPRSIVRRGGAANGCREARWIVLTSPCYQGRLCDVPIPGPSRTAFKNNRSIPGYQPRCVGFETKRITCPLPRLSTVAKAELARRCLASGHSRPPSRSLSSSTSRTGVSVGCIDIMTLLPVTVTGRWSPSPKANH